MSEARRWWRWLPAVLATLAAVVAVAVVSRKLIRGGLGDLYVFYEAAKRLAAGADLYGTPTPIVGLYYHYAPAYAFLNIPLTWISIYSAIVVWETLSVLLCAWVFLAWHRALASRPFAAEPRATRWTLGLFTTLLILRPLLSHLNFAQSNILLMAFLVLACLLLFRARDFWSGGVFGFALVLKPFAAPFLLWQLAVGNWRVLAGAAAGIVTALLAPATVVGFARNAAYLRDWLGHFEQTVTPGASGWTSSNFVSLHATVQRLFTPVVVQHLDGSSETLTLMALPPTAVQAIGVLLFVLLGGWLVAVARRYRRDPVGVASFVFALTPVVSTTAQKHYFVLLLPASLYLVHTWVARGHRDWPVAALIGAYLLALAATGELFAHRALAQYLQALGLYSLGALALAAAMQRALALSQPSGDGTSKE